MPQLKLITFDLDNTLWDVESVIVKAEAAMVEWLAQHAPDAMRAYDQETIPGLRQAVLAEFPHKRHDLSFMRTEVLYKVLTLSGYGDRQARALAREAFAVFFEGRNKVEFFPGAVDLLQRLRLRYVLYALTNGNADVQRTGLDAYLSGAISSADVGASKPHAAMFEAVLKKVSSRPHEAIHIGDHLIDDIAGAQDAGMHTVWVNLKNQDPATATHQPTRIVTSLADVDHAVEQIEKL